MNYLLTDEQRMLKEMVQSFAREKVKPVAKENDRTGKFPADLIKELSELGLMGVNCPEQYGGAGADNVSYLLTIEALSRYCASTGVIVSVQISLVEDPIYRYGTEEQKKKYLPDLCSGRKIGCYCLTEPQANIAIVFAVTDPAAGTRGMTAFIVEKESPGFNIGKSEEKLGIHASSTAEVILEDCAVPKENRLGELNRGFKLAMITLDSGRIGIAAQALGIARGSIEDSVAYARERVQFGRPITNFQGIKWYIADMTTEYEAAWLLTYRAALVKDKGLRFSKEAAMAKLKASRVAEFCASMAVHSMADTVIPGSMIRSATSGILKSPRYTRGPVRLCARLSRRTC